MTPVTLCGWCRQPLEPGQRVYVNGEGVLCHASANECKTQAERARIEAMRRRVIKRRR